MDQSDNTIQLTTSAFGSLTDGTEVTLYTLKNPQGIRVTLSPFGAAIVNIHAPDREGAYADVVLGFDSVQGYEAGHPFFGVVAGRYANRIAQGRFSLNGQTYTLATNNGPNHLHGGNAGFDEKLWAAEPFTAEGRAGVAFTLISSDGDEGYPGEVTVKVTYTLSTDDVLTIDYEATTTAPTVINLTNHSYFNLAGHDSGPMTDHLLTIMADEITPVDETLIPTGEFMPVEGTPFDFRQAKRVGQDINADHPQIVIGGGYDHNFVLRRNFQPGAVSHMATLADPGSGRVMEVHTDQPGVQFYSGNFLDGTNTGKGGAVYGHRQGLCLETQHFPDSPNHPHFPSTRLEPGDVFRSQTQFRFLTD